MEHQTAQVVNYPVLLTLFLGASAIIPVQGFTTFGGPCVTITSTDYISATRNEPCFEPNCHQEFNCPYGGCRTATVTETVQMPYWWVGQVSPTYACYSQSCTQASTQVVTCGNQGADNNDFGPPPPAPWRFGDCDTLTVTETVRTDSFGESPCLVPNCKQEHFCGQETCQPVFKTQTVHVPYTWVDRTFSSAAGYQTPACYINSCLPAITTTLC